MIDFLKGKAQSLALTVSSIIIALQIIMPMMIDVMLGAIVIAVMWASSKIGGD